MCGIAVKCQRELTKVWSRSANTDETRRGPAAAAAAAERESFKGAAAAAGIHAFNDAASFSPTKAVRDNGALCRAP